MKYPKHRANLYLVERLTDHKVAIVGAFPDFDSAQNFADACTQEYIDKGFKDDVINGRVLHRVALTTFYNV